MSRRKVTYAAALALALGALGWWSRWPTLRLDDDLPANWRWSR